MKMLAILPLLLVALCAMECCGSAPCPTDWAQFGAYCYKVSSYSSSQPGAKSLCRDLSGDLVKINSAEENEFVLQLVRQKAPSLKQVWMQRSGNRFYWSDLSVPVYYNWATGEPTSTALERCVHMYVGGHSNNLPGKASDSWNNMLCNGNSNYPNGIVCKRLP